MYAVVRETSYSPDKPIYQSQQFQEFQHEHSRLHGYQCTIVVETDQGDLGHSLADVGGYDRWSRGHGTGCRAFA